MNKGKTNVPFELGEQSIIVIQNVPAWVCGQCGESFVEIETTRRIEKLVSHAQQDGMTLGFIHFQKAA